VPSFKDGAAIGFKLFGFKQGGFFEGCACFAPGDVVIEVNGLRLNSPEVFDRLQASIAERRAAQGVLERRGERLSFTVRAP
jgi:type II secretory pathway component PulC